MTHIWHSYVHIYIIYMTHNLHRKIKFTAPGTLRVLIYILWVLVFANDFLRKNLRVLIFANLEVFFADSLQPVVTVSIQDYYNIITFSATVRRFLDVKRFLLKKQYESTNKYFGMTLFTWLNIIEYSRVSIKIWAC